MGPEGTVLLAFPSEKILLFLLCSMFMPLIGFLYLITVLLNANFLANCQALVGALTLSFPLGWCI